MHAPGIRRISTRKGFSRVCALEQVGDFLADVPYPTNCGNGAAWVFRFTAPETGAYRLEYKQPNTGDFYKTYLLYTQIHFSPNPNAGFFTVDLPRPAAPGMAFRVADLTGRTLLEQKAEAGARQQTVRAGWLPPGLYFLQVVVDGKVVGVEKLVKQ